MPFSLLSYFIFYTQPHLLLAMSLNIHASPSDLFLAEYDESPPTSFINPTPPRVPSTDTSDPTILAPPQPSITSIHSSNPNFDIRHLNFTWALSGLGSRTARHKQMWKILKWIRSTLISYTNNEPGMLPQNKRLKKGLFKKHMTIICNVTRCRNEFCRRMHHCLLCALLYDQRNDKHRSNDCPLIRIMTHALS
jgi:hypothetical protein